MAGLGDIRGAKYPAAHISPQPAKEGLHKSLPVIANEVKHLKTFVGNVPTRGVNPQPGQAELHVLSEPLRPAE